MSILSHKEKLMVKNERAAASEVLKALEGLMDGNPRVETTEVGNSTFHNVAVTKA